MTIKKNVKKIRIKNKTKLRPDIMKLVIFRSNLFTYAQLVDIDGKVLVSSSDIKIDSKSKKIEKAELVGKDVAEKAKKLGIKKIVFDRNGYKYHGRVAAIAKGARSAGLIF